MLGNISNTGSFDLLFPLQFQFVTVGYCLLISKTVTLAEKCAGHKMSASFLSTKSVPSILRPGKKKRITLEIRSETYVRLHIKCPLLFNLTNIVIWQQTLVKRFNKKFHENAFVTARMDGQSWPS
jgi:hypothetical protein